MDFVDLLKNFGFPVAALVALSIVGWRVALWVGNRIFIPIAEAHIEFITHLKQNLDSQTDMISEMTKDKHVQTEILGKIEKKTEIHSDAIKDQAAATREQTAVLSKKLDEIKLEACQYRHGT